MPTAYLTTYGMKVALSGERLEVTLPRGEAADAAQEGEELPRQRWIPLNDIEHVVVDAGVSFSTRSLSGLLRRGIPVLFLTHGKMPAGLAMPMNHQTRVLAQQLDTCRNANIRLETARSLVSAKILNQKRVLQRLAANRSEPMLGAPWLDAMAREAVIASTPDSLRGIEGAATGRYFELLAQYFPEDLPFERRSRRPPLNPPNALLSFTYTLLISELALHLRACGLEPGWGFYHEPEDNRPSLALDLLEPFRSPIADALALDLFNHRRLTPENFDHHDGGCYLRQNSRRTLFKALEDRLERQFHHEQSAHRTTLRQIMKNQCLQIKKTITSAAPFEPFRMN